MAHFGGASKFGGGLKFGGGASFYERNQDRALEWIGEGAFGDDVAKAEGGVLYRLIGVVADQFQAAEVDANRIRVEGTPSLAIETLDEWERLHFVERLVSNPDVRRWVLEKLADAQGDFISPTEAVTLATELLSLTGSGLSTTVTSHTCTIAECTTANNAGDGVRYWALLVPEWVFLDEWRDYYYLLLWLANRIDAHYCAASMPVTHDGGEPRFNVSLAGGPSFGATSIVDRDVVRD